MSNRKPVDAISLLLEAGANTNAVTPKGDSALHYAAFEGKLDIVRRSPMAEPISISRMPRARPLSGRRESAAETAPAELGRARGHAAGRPTA